MGDSMIQVRLPCELVVPVPWGLVTELRRLERSRPGNRDSGRIAELVNEISGVIDAAVDSATSAVDGVGLRVYQAGPVTGTVPACR